MVTKCAVRKTPMMLREEARLGKPLEEIIPETYKELGNLKAVADALGIKYSTLTIWLIRMGYSIKMNLVSHQQS